MQIFEITEVTVSSECEQQGNRSWVWELDKGDHNWNE